MADTANSNNAASQPPSNNKGGEQTSHDLPNPTTVTTTESADENKSNANADDKGGKRKREDGDGGSRGARGNKKRDMGRKQWQREQPDRRARQEQIRSKPREPNSQLPEPFAKEEIAAEDRRPKRKVAVLIGYSGTGYKGMQINSTERTIEGDLFKAFVAAGAISKANADDPKKSALVRCARTDKGVHAAGNMISLKLIIEDPDIVAKINEKLPEQIKVWGIERTIGSFSCYNQCDSRWYEYLLPTHCLLPPHPTSWLGRTLVSAAEEAGDREGYESRQEEVKDFWNDVEEKEIKPLLASFDQDIRELVVKAMHDEETPVEGSGNDMAMQNAADLDAGKKQPQQQPQQQQQQPSATDSAATIAATPSLTRDQKSRLEAAIKKLKQAYNDAKRRSRIPQARIERLQSALSAYVGTNNFHNYTILKPFRDPSAKRHIKSFVVNPTPIIINGTEWLSLKVHGQSFMMHQIRKMVGMASLLVRCGAPVDRIRESYGDVKFSIPKVPGLGLLLERPVFDSYNTLQAPKHEREPLDFSKFEKEMEAFKQKEIYQRLFEEEARDNAFQLFYNQIDNYRERHFLWLTSKGLAATQLPENEKEADGKKHVGGEKAGFESDDEDAGAAGAEEG